MRRRPGGAALYKQILKGAEVSGAPQYVKGGPVAGTKRYVSKRLCGASLLRQAESFVYDLPASQVDQFDGSRKVAGIEEFLKDLRCLDQVFQRYIFASVLSALDEAVDFILHSSVPGKRT
ncbi:MAG TPA: hypothetical protein VD995_24255 [Azospirillum sp.]|nr:hypothetical protein [Azospirillum sp.]